MKQNKSKIIKFLNGKGFYIVMAVCMAAVGFAAYSAMDAARLTDKEPQHDFSSSAEQNDDDITLNPTKQDDTENNNSNTPVNEDTQATPKPVQNTAVAEYFLPPIENGNISKGFDSETLQYSATYNDMRLHTGTDILATDSLLVKSCGSGTVTGIDTDTIMGTVITVDHGNGIYIRYCGIKNVNVDVGDTVTVDSSIGEVGTIPCECAEQAHLHLEVIKDGNPIDPAVLIPFN